MAFQEIGIRIVLQGVGEFRRGVTAVRSDLKSLEDGFSGTSGKTSNLTKQLSVLSDRMINLGRSMTLGLTLPIVGLGTSLLNAGIQFEDAFAGVGKTVDGVADNFGKLTPVGEKVRQQIRNLSMEIPVSAVSLAKLGEEAGQLGIQADQLVDFVEIAAKLGVATNISAEEAGSAIARLGNIMGINADQMAQFALSAGSAIVDLGNKSAATETEILSMAYRIAGAGKAIGLSTQEILALSTSVSELGVRAEAGGTAVSRILLEIQTAAVDGGDKLALFANAAGVTVDEFQNLIKNSPVIAFQKVTSGLAKMQEEGTLSSDTLRELELNTIRLRDVVNRFGPDMGLLSKNINTANTAWKEQTALNIEAQKRFATVKSQLQLLKNAFDNLGITLFDLYSGVLVNIITAFKSVINGINALSDSSLKWIVQIGGIVAAMGPLLITLGTAVKIFNILQASMQLGWTTLLAANPILLAVAAAVGIFAYAYTKNLGGIQEKTKAVIEEVKNIGYWLGKAFSFGKINTGNIFGGIAASFKALTYVYEDNKTTFFSNVLQAFGLGEEKAQEFGMAIRNVLAPGLLFISDVFNKLSNIYNQIAFIFQDFLRFTGVVDILNNALSAFLRGDFEFAFASLQLAWDHTVMWFNVEGKDLIIAALKDVLNLIVDIVKGAASLLQAEIKYWTIPFLTWVWETIPVVLEALGNLIGDLLTWIGKQIPPLADKLIEWADAFVDWVIEAAPKVIKELEGLATDIIGWLGDNYIEITKKLLEWGTAFLEWLGPVIRDILPKLAELGGKIVGWLLAFVFITLPSKIAKLVAAFIEWVPKAAVDIWPKLLEFLTTLNNYIINDLIPGIAASAISFGKGLVDGFKQGITDNWDQFKTDVKGKVDGFVSDVAGWLGVGSPSKVFQEFGEATVAGFIIGMQDLQSQLATVSESVFGNTLKIAAVATPLTNSLANVPISNTNTNTTYINNQRTFAPNVSGVPITGQQDMLNGLDHMYRLATLASG